MPLLTTSTWLVFLSLISTFYTKELSKGLAYLWLAIIAIILILFTSDLDLLASAIIAIYSSVFLFLTLLGMVQTSYEAKSDSSSLANKGIVLNLVLTVALLFVFEPTVNTSFSNPHSFCYVLWTDVYLLTSECVYAAAVGLHFMFYKVFVGETIVFNLYILLGLIVAVLLLNSMRMFFKKNTSKALTHSPLSTLNHTAPLLTNVRTVYSFRRQTRRKNNSITRFSL